MWRDFFILRSSADFIERWKTFLLEANLPETPVFYQHVTDLIFRALIKLHFARPAADGEESRAMSSTELNALRLCCRVYLLRKSKAANSKELLDCMTTLVRGDKEECDGENEEWTFLIDRGGLWKIKENTFKVFCALEEEIRLSLRQLILEQGTSHKKKLSSQLVSSDDVQFYC